MRVIDERGLVWDESPYFAHHGIMGMHWGIRRYQPYPGDYNGDGRFVGKKKRTEYDLGNKKVPIKSKKQIKKEFNAQLKSEMKAQRETYRSNYNASFALNKLLHGRGTEQVFNDRLNELKRSNAKYEEAKKKTYDLITEMDRQGYKYEMIRPPKFFTNGYDYQKSKAKVKIRELGPDEIGNVKASYNIKTGKFEDPRDQRYAALEKKRASDYDKKFAGNDTSTKLPQKDKNSRTVEQKELLDKAEAVDKVRRDFIESKIKKYNPKNSEERDIAIDKVEKANRGKLGKLHEESNAAWKRYDASRLKQRDFNKARSLRKRGLTYIEIAERLGVPPTTVWGILNY